MVGLNVEHDYHTLLREIIQTGVKKTTRSGTTIGVFQRTLRHKMSKGFPLFTTRKMNFNNVKIEALWMLSGETNIKYLLDNNVHIWTADAFRGYKKYRSEIIEICDTHGYIRPAFLEKDPQTEKEFEVLIQTDPEYLNFGDLGQTYGTMWKGWPDEYGDRSINQITRLLDLLRTDPDSRRMVVSTYNPTFADSLTLPPCHTNWQVWTRELRTGERVIQFLKINKGTKMSEMFNLFGKWLLETHEKVVTEQTVVNQSSYMHEFFDTYNLPRREISISFSMRSVDIPLGNNIHLYAMILLLIADEVNMVPGDVVANYNDAHIYENQVDGVVEMLNREAYDLPTVTVKNGLSAKSDDIEIHNYKHHPFIKFPLSVG